MVWSLTPIQSIKPRFSGIAELAFYTPKGDTIPWKTLDYGDVQEKIGKLDKTNPLIRPSVIDDPKRRGLFFLNNDGKPHWDNYVRVQGKAMDLTAEYYTKRKRMHPRTNDLFEVVFKYQQALVDAYLASGNAIERAKRRVLIDDKGDYQNVTDQQFHDWGANRLVKAIKLPQKRKPKDKE